MQTVMTLTTLLIWTIQNYCAGRNDECFCGYSFQAGQALLMYSSLFVSVTRGLRQQLTCSCSARASDQLPAFSAARSWS